MKPRLRIGHLVAASVLLATATLVSISTASAGRSGPRGAISLLKVGTTLPATTLDMTRGGNDMSLGLEKLFQIGPDGKLHPWLARSVSRPGRAVYLYHLRRGVKFWDGKELTAVDVATSWNYERYPGSYSAYLFKSAKTIEAVDRYTVRVTLKHPDASWQWVPALARAGVFQKAFFEAHKPTWGQPGTLEMGTGPWRPVKLGTTGIEFEAHPRWWGGNVPIDHISVKFFADENSMALAMRAGEVDIAPGIADPRAFRATSGGANIASRPSCDNAYVSMDTLHAPWNDVHVRRAVAYAVNRSDLVEAVAGNGTPYYSLDPPYLLRSVGSAAQVNGLVRSLSLYKNRFNLAKAKQEMALSAYPNGISSAPIVVYDYGVFPRITEVVAAQLRAIGINASPKVLPIGQWIALVNEPSRPMGIQVSGGTCDTPDPNENPKFLLGSWNARPGQFNLANYGPPAVDALLKAGLATSVPAKRFTVYSRLLRRLDTDVPYVPLFNPNGTVAISSKFAWPTYNAQYYNRVWALEVKPT